MSNVACSVGVLPGTRYSADEMCRYILLALVVALILLMVVAAIVVQEYGWPGFLVYLAGLVLLAVIARRAFPHIFAHLLMRPLRQMGAALRGARIVVHSVVPCEAPSSEEWEPDDSDYDEPDEERPRIADRPRPDEDPDADERIADEDEDEDESTAELRWYRLEFSVIPPDAGPSQGRMVTRKAWLPQMISAVGGRPDIRSANPFHRWPPDDLTSDDVHQVDVELWTGSEYEPVEAEVFGEQRLRMRVGVSSNVRELTIAYAHFTEIGEVRLPRIDVSPGPGP